MQNNDGKKREVRPLGVIALIMAIIYSIPIVLMFFVDNPVIKLLGFAAIPITIISYATAKTKGSCISGLSIVTSRMSKRLFSEVLMCSACCK